MTPNFNNRLYAPNRPTIAIAFAFFVFLSVEQSIAQIAVPGAQTKQARLNESTQSGLHPPHDFEQRILHTTDDRRLIVINRDRRSFDIVAVDTGRLVCRLPTFVDNLGGGQRQDARITADKLSLWTLLRGNTSRVGGQVEMSDVLRGKNPESDQELINRMREMALSGSGIVQWNLRTGEATRALKPSGRAVVAFDYSSVGGNERIIAIESEVGGTIPGRAYVVLYDITKLEKVTEYLLPPSVSTESVRFAQDGRSLVLQSRDYPPRLLAYSIHETSKLLRLWTFTETERIGPRDWHMKNSYVTNDNVFVVEEADGYIDGRTREEIPTKSRVVSLDVGTGKRNGSWRIDVHSPLHIDSYRLRMSRNDEGVLVIGGPFINYDPHDYSTIVLDTSQQSSNVTLLRNQVFTAVGRNGELISHLGVYDPTGRPLRPFERQLIDDDGVPVLDSSAVMGELVASSPEVAVVAGNEGLWLINKQTGAELAALSEKELAGLAGVTTQYDFGRATGIDIAGSRAFLVAVPHTFSDLEERMLEARARDKGGKMMHHALTDEKVRRVVEYTEGMNWDVFRISTVDYTVKQWTRIESSVWVRLLHFGDRIVVGRLGHLHEQLELRFCNLRGEILAKWENLQPKAPKIIAGLYDSGLTWLWSGLTPTHRIRLFALGDQVCLIVSLGTQQVTDKANLRQFDLEGQLTDTHQLHVQTSPFFELDNSDNVTSFTVNKWLGQDPIAFDYCPTADGIVSIGHPPVYSNEKALFGRQSSSAQGEVGGIGIKVQRYTGEEDEPFDVLRFTTARAIHRGIPNNFDDRLPDTPAITRFEVDDTGMFGWVEYSVAECEAVLVYLPTLTQIARIKRPAAFAMDADGTLLTASGSVDLHELKRLGARALNRDAVSAPAQSRRELDLIRTSDAQKPRLYYLGVAGSDFRDARFSPLQYCENDIAAIGRSLSRRAEREDMTFHAWEFASKSTQSITLEERLAELVSIAKPEDTVVLAFATHGVRLERGLYLVMPQTRADSPQGTALGWPSVAKVIQKLRAQRVIVLLDTCHAESFSESSTEFLQQIQDDLRMRPGLTVMASCRAGQQAHELDSERHGAFTHSLVSAFQRDGLTLELNAERFAAVSTRVMELTDREQEPVLLIHNPL